MILRRGQQSSCKLAVIASVTASTRMADESRVSTSASTSSTSASASTSTGSTSSTSTCHVQPHYKQQKWTGIRKQKVATSSFCSTTDNKNNSSVFGGGGGGGGGGGRKTSRRTWWCCVLGVLGFFLLQICTYFVFLDGIEISSTIQTKATATATVTARRKIMSSTIVTVYADDDPLTCSTTTKDTTAIQTNTKSSLSFLSWFHQKDTTTPHDQNAERENEHNQNVNHGIDNNSEQQHGGDTQEDRNINNAADHNQNNDHKPIVMVGGSDGSGTRAVVQLLRELGTIIVADDPHTFDVHASELRQGWPGLIHRVYSSFGGNPNNEDDDTSRNNSYDNGNSSHDGDHTIFSSSSLSSRNGTTTLAGINYDWPPPPPRQDEEEDPKKVHANHTTTDDSAATNATTTTTTTTNNHRKRIEAEIETLKAGWETKYQTPKLKVFSSRNGIRRITFPHAVAHKVKYAIKAPVSMLVLPLFASSFFQSSQSVKSSSQSKSQSQSHHNPKQPPPVLKFLHVLRDGRDIAVSINQSPVLKFYDLTYPIRQ